MSKAATLGIIAGSGSLPLQIVESCQSSGRPFFVLAVEDAADIGVFRHLPHAVVRVGAVGEAIERLRGAGATELVMAGKIKRPSMFSLRPDAAGAKLLARMGGAVFGGDDALLKALIGFLEEEGFSIVGADDVLGGLLMPEGVLGKHRPTRRDKEDIVLGMQATKKLGELDIGQAVIVENGYVLGVEAAEGTDALIQRCGQLRREAKSGVLVKAKKPRQERRADLPAIGVKTVEKLYEAGFAGLAAEAGGALLLERDALIERADALGLFVIGIRHE